MFYTVERTVKPMYQPLFNRLGASAEDVFKRYSTIHNNPRTINFPNPSEYTTARLCITTNHSTHAIDFLYENPECIDWDYICQNRSPTIGTLLDRYKGSIQWNQVSSNPSAASFLSTNIEHINWFLFSENNSDNALDIMEQYPERINYSSLSSNTNPRAIKLLKTNIDKINWVSLSSNPSALEILREHPDQIFWTEFSKNKNPEALQMMIDNIDLVDIYAMGGNTAAIPWLKQNLRYVDWVEICMKARTPEHFQFIRENISHASWQYLSSNTYATQLLMEYPDRISIFALQCQDLFDYSYEYDYKGIRDAKRTLHEEYHAWAGHPARMYKWKDWGMWEDVLDEEEDA